MSFNATFPKRKEQKPSEVPQVPQATQETQDRPTRRQIYRHVDEYSEVLKGMHPCTNPYVAFSPKPKHVGFESQAQEEHIVLFVRKHLVTQVRWIISAVIFALMPLVLQFVPFLDFFPVRFHLLLIAGWYLFILGYCLENFLVWFFNVNIFTDERIVDIDFYSMLYKKISTAQIDRVEDVTSTTGGFFGSVLNYGTVDIQTAANTRELSFEQVPHPEKVVQILNELIMEEERERLMGRNQ